MNSKIVSLQIRNNKQNFTYDRSVPESNFDSNPSKYLVVYGDDPRFKDVFRHLDETDAKVGDTNSVPSNTVMVRYLNILLSQKEEEFQDRILLIQERDTELQRLIDEIHRVYSSKRYKLGHMLIGPVESFISRLRRK